MGVRQRSPQLVRPAGAPRPAVPPALLHLPDSGDHDPNDSAHGTFFQLLPTPRLYARFPFFNLMNSTDGFGELILRPSKRLLTRIDVHSLHLADPNDLWYQGGGAFQPTTFGYVGQPGGGRRGLVSPPRTTPAPMSR